MTDEEKRFDRKEEARLDDMYDAQCERCGEVEPAEIHTCTPQEPVAWHEPGAYSNVTAHEKWAKENGWLPLYTAPPQREWQGLTDAEAEQIVDDYWHDVDMFIEAIEAKLKEKNSD